MLLVKTLDDDPVPWVLRQWRYWAYDVLPPVGFCFGNGQPKVSFSLSLASAVVLGTLVFLVRQVLVSGFHFSATAVSTTAAACSLVSMLHSSSLVTALFHLLFTTRRRQRHHGIAVADYQPAERLEAAPVWWQESAHAVLQFCTGYMLYDVVAVLYLCYARAREQQSQESQSQQLLLAMSSDDYLFLLHHASTILYMTAVRVVRAGHVSALACMFLGEVTNPLHNFHYVLQIALLQDDHDDQHSLVGPSSWSVLQTLQYVNDAAFASLYIFVRVVVGIPFCLHVSYHLLRYGYANGIPRWMVAAFVVLIWGVMAASVAWVQLCWNILQNYLPNNNNNVVALEF